MLKIPHWLDIEVLSLTHRPRIDAEPTPGPRCGRKDHVTSSPRLSVRKRTMPTERPPRLAKLQATFAGRGWGVVMAAGPYGR
jgi:hypothetical protein